MTVNIWPENGVPDINTYLKVLMSCCSSQYNLLAIFVGNINVMKTPVNILVEHQQVCTNSSYFIQILIVKTLDGMELQCRIHDAAQLIYEQGHAVIKNELKARSLSWLLIRFFPIDTNRFITLEHN